MKDDEDKLLTWDEILDLMFSYRKLVDEDENIKPVKKRLKLKVIDREISKHKCSFF